MLQSSVRKNSNSPLEISSNVQHQIMLITQKEKDDLTLYGSPAPTRSNRSATVKRAATLNKTQAESINNISIDDDSSNSISKTETSPEPFSPGERYRKSLDSTYRHSLESISEYKTKHSFSSACLFPNRDATSIESTTSDCTDYAVRSSTDVTKDKTLVSASSSYLSWIESVNSEYFGSANSTAETVDIDNKVGEWNNFWLNYNSSNNRYLSSPFLYTSTDEKTLEDLSDCKSTCSTQREYTEKQTYLDQYYLSHDEITETIRCTQRITEILQNALKRTNENDFDDSRNDSYYSQMFPALFSVCFCCLIFLLDNCVILNFSTLEKKKRLQKKEYDRIP